MSAVLGHIIVIAILALIVFFAARSTVRGLSRELKGEGCSGCGSGDSGSCSCCSKNKKK